MLRRAAVLAAAVVVPVVVALVVLVNVLGPDGDGGNGPVADIEGTTSAPRGDLPTIVVDTPEVTAEAELACPVLMGQLPLELAGENSRMVRSDSPYAYAWGDPAVVLICGVAPPAGFVADAATLVVSGVQWFVDTSDPDTVVWTTVDRIVPVEVRVPASADSAVPTALSPIIATALPYTEPVPAG
ncbi:Protein of unknown function [Modestobacter sp. DSM 44400]|uniref:DUF3515 domain-containing protein n=1 Tax=Modestobacter sp. DSM 44400 TaxID=1550230 RepID=UPI000896FABA|nr:DUF3515 domain-containing protein [Modestobacter sp. DSM 44400]SDX67577.1 Protein of unknown function [Modestobacter sp. DSM 44400]